MSVSISSVISKSDFFTSAIHCKPSGFNPKLNKLIAGLTDPYNLMYGSDRLIDIVGCIKDDDVCLYQDAILKNAVDSSTVDVDQMILHLNVTSKEIELLTNDKFGLLNVKTKSRRGILSVIESKDLSSANQYLKEGDSRSYYTNRYSMILSGDSYRKVEVLIGDPAHAKNIGRPNIKHNVQINFIPTRLTLAEISVAFWHLKSVLKNNRYYTIMKNAMVSRFDIGVNIFGFSHLFCFANTIDRRICHGSSWPLGEISQSAYLSLLSNNHIIHYDKILKEAVLFLKFHGVKTDGHQLVDLIKEHPDFADFYAKCPCVARAEGRHIAHKKLFKINELSSVKCLLANVRYIKPQHLRLVPETLIEKAVSEKSIKNIRSIAKWLIEVGNVKECDLYYCFDSVVLQNSASEKLSELVNVILNPEKITSDPSNGINYSELAREAKLILTRTAECRVIENPSDITIDEKKITFIEGGAGAGKTALIVKLIKNNGKAKQYRTTVLSFTNASVKDISQSLDRSLSSNQVSVETISRWCKQFLESSGYIINKLIDNQRSYVIMQEFLDEILPQGESEEEITGEDLFKVYSYYRNRSQPDLTVSIKKVNEDLLKHRKVIQEVINRYKQYKKATKQEDFDGVIEQVASLLENKKVAKKFIGKMEYLFVDEIQDFNSTQWDILKKLKKYGVKIVVVGDRAQSIYQWRGAIPDELNDQDLKVYKLQINYRSTQQIVNLTNFIRTKICKTLLEVISRGSDGKIRNGMKPRLYSSDNITAASDWVKKDINAKGIKNRDCFILCRFRKQMLHFEKIFGKGNVGLASDPVMTFHSSKGLQSKHVYVIDPRFSWMGFTNAQDELCNLYVALSRAMDTLTIVKANKTVFRKSKPDQKKLNILDVFDETLVEFV